MNLVRATAADLPDVAALMNRAFRGTVGWALEEGYLVGDRIRLADLAAEIDAKPRLRLLLWREGDGLLGCVGLEPLVEGIWYLSMLAVEPGRQDAGLGRRLLEEAEAVARREGANRVRLTVIFLRDNLIAWYERRGYVRVGTAPFPYGDDRWGKPTRDDLHFVVLEKPLA